MDLKQARMKKNFTQTDLALKAGIPQPHLSNIEAGKIFPMPETRQKIETALGCRVDWIITRIQGNMIFVPDGQTATENAVMAAISIFVQMANPSQYDQKFRFLSEFLRKYKKHLKEKG